MRLPERASRGAALLASLIALAMAASCRTSGGSEGGSVDLRAEAPDYSRTIAQRINGNWDRGRAGAPRGSAEIAAGSEGGIVMISFSINGRGAIRGQPAVEESSGSETLDEEAIRAVTDAAPFPPLPRGLGTDRVDLLWRFERVPAKGRFQ